MTKNNLNPNQELSIFERLRLAEAAETKLPAEAYDLLVNAMASDPDALDLEEVQRICKAAGFTADDLERHVRLLRPLATGQARLAEEEIEAQRAVQAEITAERLRLREHYGVNTTPSGEYRVQLDQLASRALLARRRIEAARKKLAEMERSHAALVAELRGEPIPPVVQPKRSKCEVDQSATKVTRRPNAYDKYDQRWQVRQERNGAVAYYFQGKRVSA